MSQIYNPESDCIAEIETLELEARDARRKINSVQNLSDRRVLSRQLQELEERISYLQARLPF